MIKCLRCGLCKDSCPAGISPQVMIDLYKKDMELAKYYVYSHNPFAGVCAYICPNKFCMNKCKNNINIKEIQQNIINTPDSGWYTDVCIIPTSEVIIVGGGVSGLTAAYYLSRHNIKVHLYEKADTLGGQLNLIPDSRLPRNVLEYDIHRIIDSPNIIVHLNSEFIMEKENKLPMLWCRGNIPNKLENYEDQIYYDEYLLKKEFKEEDLAIIGAGQVAIDCASCNKGTSMIFSRRPFEKMRLDPEDYDIIREKNINVVSEFKLIKIVDNTIYGNINGEDYEKTFDKIVFAVGNKALDTNYGTVVENVMNMKNKVEIFKNAL